MMNLIDNINILVFRSFNSFHKSCIMKVTKVIFSNDDRILYLESQEKWKEKIHS